METISTLIGVGIVVYFGYRLFNGFYIAPESQISNPQNNSLNTLDNLVDAEGQYNTNFDKIKLDISFEEQMSINSMVSILEASSKDRKNEIYYKIDKEAQNFVTVYFNTIYSIALFMNKLDLSSDEKEVISKYNSDKDFISQKLNAFTILISSILNQNSSFLEIRYNIEKWVYDVRQEIFQSRHIPSKTINDITINFLESEEEREISTFLKKLIRGIKYEPNLISNVEADFNDAVLEVSYLLFKCGVKRIKNNDTETKVLSLNPIVLKAYIEKFEKDFKLKLQENYFKDTNDEDIDYYVEDWVLKFKNDAFILFEYLRLNNK